MQDFQRPVNAVAARRSMAYVRRAAAGFLALRQAEPGAQAAALTFMAGVLLLATIEDTVQQGDEPSPPRVYSSLAFAAGFVLMMAAREAVES